MGNKMESKSHNSLLCEIYLNFYNPTINPCFAHILGLLNIKQTYTGLTQHPARQLFLAWYDLLYFTLSNITILNDDLNH